MLHAFQDCNQNGILDRCDILATTTPFRTNVNFCNQNPTLN